MGINDNSNNQAAPAAQPQQPAQAAPQTPVTPQQPQVPPQQQYQNPGQPGAQATPPYQVPPQQGGYNVPPVGQVPPYGQQNYGNFGATAPNQQPTSNLSLDTFSREVSKSQDSDTLVNLNTSLEELLKHSPKTKSEVVFISADIAENDLPYSLLLMAKPKSTAGGKTVVPYYTIVIANSRPDGFEPNNVQTVTGALNVPQTVADALANDLVQQLIRDRVNKGIGNKYGKNLEFYDTGVTAIGEQFDAKELHQVKGLLSDAIVAMDNKLMRLSNTGKVFTVASLANSRVSIRGVFNHGKTLDTAKNPVRTDIMLTVTTGAFNNNQNKFVGQNRDVVSVGGYIDLVNIDRGGQQNYGQYFAPQPQIQAYLPVFVMTSITSSFDLSSDQIVLLGISAVGALAARKNWARSLLAQDSSSIHDFGGIGIETPRFASTDGKARRIDLRKLPPMAQAELINDAVMDQLMIDIDVPEIGDAGRMLELVNGIASTDPNVRTAAINRLMKAGDELSLYNFAPTWAQLLSTTQGASGNFTIGNATKVFNGYYIDSTKSEPADIRNIDHLAVVNIKGAQEPGAGRIYDATYYNGEAPDVQATRRLETQERLLGGAGMVTLTGASYRHRLNPLLITALDKALRTAGLNLDLQNPGYNGQGMEQVTYDQFIGQGLTSQMFQGYYTGTHYGANQGQTNNGATGRYRG